MIRHPPWWSPLTFSTRCSARLLSMLTVQALAHSPSTSVPNTSHVKLSTHSSFCNRRSTIDRRQLDCLVQHVQCWNLFGTDGPFAWRDHLRAVTPPSSVNDDHDFCMRRAGEQLPKPSDSSRKKCGDSSSSAVRGKLDKEVKCPSWPRTRTLFYPFQLCVSPAIGFHAWCMRRATARSELSSWSCHKHTKPSSERRWTVDLRIRDRSIARAFDGQSSIVSWRTHVCSHLPQAPARNFSKVLCSLVSTTSSVRVFALKEHPYLISHCYDQWF